jgi:uncharacterized membrane protein (DUF485 family)
MKANLLTRSLSITIACLFLISTFVLCAVYTQFLFQVYEQAEDAVKNSFAGTDNYLLSLVRN